MASLRYLFYFFLLVVATILLQSPLARGQSPDAKTKGTGSISGHITIGGKAAAGIAVAAFGSETVNRRVPAAQTTTDSEGAYRLSGLAPTQYQVATLAPNLTNAETSLDPSFGFFYGSSKSILLSAGEQVEDVDIKLARGGVITGRVTDADSKPVIEVRVSLLSIQDSTSPNQTRPPIISIGEMYQTDDRGVYRIYGLPAGRYKVSVGSDPGGGMVGSGRGYYLRTYHPDVTDASRATIIELLEGSEATNVDIHVGRREDTFSVTGRVVDSETGAPIGGARVGFVVAPKDQERFSPFLSGYPMGTDGNFKLDGLAPGRYGAYVSSDYDGGDVYSDPVYFDILDKDVSGVEIKAVHGLSISGVIESEVIPLKDLLAQLPGLRVSANIAMPPQSALRSGGSGTVMPDGSFQVNGLRPGRASIGVYSADGSKRPSIVGIDHDGIGITQGFELQPGQSVSGLRIVIAYGTGVIRGTVKFAGGPPPAGTRTFISCSREGSRSSAGGAQLDARGHFIIRGLAPGTYEVTMRALVPVGTSTGQRPRPPQKQFVNVINDAEAEVTFAVELGVKEGAP